jgi:hypothetical protein
MHGSIMKKEEIVKILEKIDFMFDECDGDVRATKMEMVAQMIADAKTLSADEKGKAKHLIDAEDWSGLKKYLEGR